MEPRPTLELAGVPIPRIGFGAMNLSIAGRPDRAQAIDVLHSVLDAGVRLIDTADAYCLNDADTGHNETLIAEALRSWAGPGDDVLVATKGGHVRGPDGSWLVDGRPEHLREACDASLRRLGVDTIGLYQFHRPDPTVPYAESVGAVAELRDAGKVRAVGVSNATVDQIDEARSIADAISVQNEFGPDFLSSTGELDHCEEAGLAFLAWAPLGGRGAASRLGANHPLLAAVAEEHGVSAQQVALAWELAQGELVVPIPGARRVETALDCVAALTLELTPDQLKRLDEQYR